MPTLKKSKNTQFDKEYAAFIGGLDLVAIGLKSCSSRLDRSAFFKLAQKSNKSEKTFTQEYRLGVLREEYFDAEGQFTVAIHGADKSSAPLSMEFIFEAHIHG